MKIQQPCFKKKVQREMRYEKKVAAGRRCYYDKKYLNKIAISKF